MILLVVTGSVFAQTKTSSDEVKPLPITKVADGIYAHLGRLEVWSAANRGDTANLSFVVGTECVAVIDTGSTFKVGLGLKRAIRLISQLPICYVINTHAHPDHMLGNGAFEDENTQFVAHQNMTRAQATRGQNYLTAVQRDLGDAAIDTKLVAPTVLVSDEAVLDLGGRTLVVTAHKTAHTDADISIFDPEARILWLGDLAFVTHLPAVDGNLNGWIKLMDEFAKKKAAIAIPGHGSWTAPGWPKMLTQQQRYLIDLRKTVRQAIKDGKTLAETLAENHVGRDGGWAVYKEFHQRNVSAAFAELEWE
ncbi:MAG: quinoprotein relay system zinc metallohydrolase 2 [Burkholderiaceae bacterium]